MNINKRTNKDGKTTYQIRVLVSQTADGKQRTCSKTWIPPVGMSQKAAEKEAVRQATIFEHEVKQGRAPPDAKTKVSDVAKEYIRNTEMEYKTKEWYEYMLSVVEDDIGNMPISALKAYQIERIYADMREPDAKRTYCVTATALDKIRREKGMTYKALAEKAGLCIDTVQIACKGCRVALESADKMAKTLQCPVEKAFKLEVRESPYSSTTINGVHRFLRAVCHYAEKHKLLTDNPIDAVRAPKIDAEIYVFSEEESKRFVRAVMREKDIRVKTALLILIYLGLRKGELCGLTWGNVDLDKGIIHVAQQLKEKSGEGLALGKLKTKESKADLPLSPMLAGVLAEYRQWWTEHKAMYGDAWRGEWECLFIGDDGAPLNPGTINEWLDKLTERNDLPHVTVHSIRHLCATLLIRANADPKTVQTILRHANISTTLNIYAKVFESTQIEAVGRIQASLENMLKDSCSSCAQVNGEN